LRCIAESKNECHYPCSIQDEVGEILEKIIYADSLAIAGGVRWGHITDTWWPFVSRLTSLEHNRQSIWRERGREPIEAKYFSVLISYEAELGNAIEDVVGPLNRLGFNPLSYAGIHRPNILSNGMVRLAAKFLYTKTNWIDNALRLHARSLILLPLQFKLFGYEYDDHLVDEKPS
jgi:hypothetical protein